MREQPRSGMALAVTIGVVSLIAVLAVATLSLTGQLQQTSTLAMRDARLDAGAAFGLATLVDQWRARQVGRLAIGSSTSFSEPVSGVPISVRVTVTRIGPEIFWVVADATSGSARRSENVILRSRVPPGSSLLAEDSTNVTSLGPISVDSLAATAQVQAPSGAILTSPAGVIHVRGDATLLGGSGSGILIVDGRLFISAPLSYEGIIITKGGISATGPGVHVTGMIRAAGSPRLAGTLGVTPDGAVVQDVMVQSVTPSPVAGRRWAELY